MIPIAFNMVLFRDNMIPFIQNVILLGITFSFVSEYLLRDMFIISTFSITSLEQYLMEWDYRRLIHTLFNVSHLLQSILR